MTRQKRYHQRKPWVRFVEYARRRCRDPKHRDYPNYGGRGITCNLKAADLEFLWLRDRGDLLQRPSLDRIDSNQGYTVENCRFIEFSLNAKLGNYTSKKTMAELQPEPDEMEAAPC